MMSVFQQEELGKAAFRLYLACARGSGIDEAMENIHVLYGCPKVDEPVGVIYASSRAKDRHRR